jgi:hypothetical protein
VELFATPLTAFITIAAISAGYGLILLRVIWHYQSKIKELEDKIDILQQRMEWQQGILMKNFPTDAVNLTVEGNVSDSTVSAAGRKVGR